MESPGGQPPWGLWEHTRQCAAAAAARLITTPALPELALHVDISMLTDAKPVGGLACAREASTLAVPSSCRRP